MSDLGKWLVAWNVHYAVERFSRGMRDLETAGVGMEERAQTNMALIQKAAEQIEQQRTEAREP